MQPSNQKPTYISSSSSKSGTIWKILFIVSTAVLILVCGVLGLMFSTTSSELNLTKNTLITAQNQLTSTGSDLTTARQTLINTRNELKATQNSLDDTSSQLDDTQSQLNSTKTQLASTQNQLESSTNQLESTKANLANYQSQLVVANTNLFSTKNELDTLKVQYTDATTGYAYVLNDPTYAEALSFISSDRTNNNTYNIVTYNCFNFAADTITNAQKQHIRCGFVYIEFPDGAHAIIAFNTTDKGILYIEPQSDNIVQLKVGGHYYQEEIPPSGYYITQPDYNDTVEDFTVVW